MADIKNVKTQNEAVATKPAEVKTETKEVKPVTISAATTKTPVEKKPATKTATKKAVTKKPATAKKTVAKKSTTPVKATTKTAAKATVKKAVAAPKATVATRKKKAEPVDKTDAVKTALWKAINKAKAKKIKDYIAIQIWAEGLDSFFIAVHDGVPMIERAHYQGHAGDLQISEKDLMNIAAGKFDLIKAVKTGDVNFHGKLFVLLKILDLF